MNLYDKPRYADDKSTDDNLREMYNYTATLVEGINRDKSTSARKAVYAGTTSSGTVTLPADAMGGTLFVAVIGGVPCLAVCHEGALCARGGNADTEVYMTATLRGTTLSFSASHALRKLIVLL